MELTAARIQESPLTLGQLDIAAAIRRTISHSEGLSVLAKLKRSRVLWRLAVPLKYELLARRIT